MSKFKKLPFELSDIRSRTIKRNASGKDAELSMLTAIQDLKGWKSVYAECIEQRSFEISQLIQRNNFLMIFQGVLFAGVCQSAGTIPIVSFIICLVGFFASISQASMAAGAKYWQEHWEAGTREAEMEMIKLMAIHRVQRNQISSRELVVSSSLLERLETRQIIAHLFEDNGREDEIRESLKRSRPRAIFLNEFIMLRFSTSRIPIYVGLFCAFAWLVLLICTVRFDLLDTHVFSWITGFDKREPI